MVPNESKREVAGKCVLSDIRGHPYFWEPSPDPIAYFADDSLALERYTRKTLSKRALDLCAGPGIQSLSLSQHSNHVTAVEVDEAAYKILLINVEMNENNSKITALHASASDFLSQTTETFDQVVCNPPLLPLPNDLKYPSLGHGGEDGLRVTREVVRRASSFLSPEGVIELIGCSLYSDIGLAVLGFFEDLSIQNNLETTLLSLSRYPWRRGSLFFQNLVATSLYQNPRSETDASERMRLFMEKEKDLGMVFFFAKVNRGTPLNRGLKIIDFSSIYKNGWVF